MDSSPTNKSTNSTLQLPRIRFPLLRFFGASILLGPLYGFVTFLYLVQTPPWIASIAIAAAIVFPTLWILRPELQQHGLRGLPTTKLLLVSFCFAVACTLSFFIFCVVAFTAWPYLDLTPMPSD